MQIQSNYIQTKVIQQINKYLTHFYQAHSFYKRFSEDIFQDCILLYLERTTDPQNKLSLEISSIVNCITKRYQREQQKQKKLYAYLDDTIKKGQMKKNTNNLMDKLTMPLEEQNKLFLKKEAKKQKPYFSDIVDVKYFLQTKYNIETSNVYYSKKGKDQKSILVKGNCPVCETNRCLAIVQDNCSMRSHYFFHCFRRSDILTKRKRNLKTLFAIIENPNILLAAVEDK